MARIQKSRFGGARPAIRSAFAPRQGVADNKVAMPKKPKSNPKPAKVSNPVGAGSVRPAAPKPKAYTPWDTTYERQANQIYSRYNNAVSANANRSGQIRRGYGLDAGFDVNNPYSQAALLQRNYDQARAGSQNSYAASGQFLSGAMNRALREGQFDYTAARAGLAARQEADLAELVQADLAAARERDLDLEAADWQRLQTALSEDAPLPSPGRAGAKPQISSSWAKPAKKQKKRHKAKMTSKWGE